MHTLLLIVFIHSLGYRCLAFGLGGLIDGLTGGNHDQGQKGWDPKEWLPGWPQSNPDTRGPLTSNSRTAIIDTSSNRPVPTPPTTVVPMPDPSSQATINNVGAIETSIKTMTQTVAPESPLPTTTSSSYSSAIIDINYVTDIVTTTTNGTTITVSSTLTANALTHTTAISAASTSTELSPVDTQPPSPTNISQSNPQHTKAVVIGAVLGTLLGVLLILTLILVYIRYRRRKYNSTASSIAFDREKMVSGHWWSSPRYTFGKRSHIDTRHESEPDDVSLAPSDSVSQLWSKGDPSDRLVPLRAPHFSEKVDGN